MNLQLLQTKQSFIYTLHVDQSIKRMDPIAVTEKKQRTD